MSDYALVKQSLLPVAEFQKALTERIDQTLEGIRGALAKALSMKQRSESDALHDLGPLGLKLQSISDSQSQLLQWNQELSRLGSTKQPEKWVHTILLAGFASIIINLQRMLFR